MNEVAGVPNDASGAASAMGAVVIGRNEGPRLERCLRSIIRQCSAVVYADSGSTDGSPAQARLAGCEVIELDPSRPFSAARSRNEGFALLRSLHPSISHVQFVDGDCEVEAGWMERAGRELAERKEAAVVFGALEERDPESSVYNRLCHMEWQRAPGEVLASGGIFMARAEAFERVGGFNAAIVAGEEPELCLRLRGAGWKIICLPDPMAIHEAGMTRFSQWWKRTVRAGHGYAQGMAIRGFSGEKHDARQVVSALSWGFLAPAAALASLAVSPWVRWSPWIAGAVFLGFAALAWRVYRSRRSLGDGPRDARLYAFFCLLSKPAMALGVLKYFLNRLRGASPAIIEYKTGPVESPRPLEKTR